MVSVLVKTKTCPSSLPEITDAISIIAFTQEDDLHRYNEAQFISTQSASILEKEEEDVQTNRDENGGKDEHKGHACDEVSFARLHQF